MGRGPVQAPTDRFFDRVRRGPWLILSILGIALFAIVIAVTGFEQIGAVGDADISWVLVTVLFGIGVTLISTFRWGYITNCLTERAVLSWAQYWSALMTSRVLGLVVPRSASDLGVRFIALTGLGRTPPGIAGASVALDQLFDLALLVSILAPTLLILGGAGVWAWYLAAMAAVVGVILMFRLGPGLRWLAARLASMASWLGHRGGRASSFFHRRAAGMERLSTLRSFTPGQSAVISASTLVRYTLNAGMFWSISQALGLSISFATFTLVGAGVQLSLVAAVTPGGLGIMDLGWAGLLTLSGAQGEAVGTFILGQRAFQYTFFPLMAGLSYLLVARRSGVSGRHDAVDNA